MSISIGFDEIVNKSLGMLSLYIWVAILYFFRILHDPWSMEWYFDCIAYSSYRNIPLLLDNLNHY